MSLCGDGDHGRGLRPGVGVGKGQVRRKRFRRHWLYGAGGEGGGVGGEEGTLVLLGKMTGTVIACIAGAGAGADAADFVSAEGDGGVGCCGATAAEGCRSVPARFPASIYALHKLFI